MIIFTVKKQWKQAIGGSGEKGSPFKESVENATEIYFADTLWDSWF